jgi:hypothetical protein
MHAFASIKGGFAEAYACFDYGPWVDSTDAAVAGAAWVHGEIAVMTRKARDVQDFGFDPASRSNPQAATLAAYVLDPTMSTGTLTLNVATVKLSLTFTADVAAPQPWERDHVSESIDQTSDPQVCVGQGVTSGMSRSGSIVGSISSSKAGGGAVHGGGADVWQGAYEYGYGAYAPAPETCHYFLFF